MLDIILCSKKISLMERSIDVINMTLANYDGDYHIYKFMSNSKLLNDYINMGGSKIYVLDIDDSRQVADLIRRKDFDSVIIFVSLTDKVTKQLFNCGYMTLDFICLNDAFEDRFKNALYLAIKILYRNHALIFRYNHVIYRIPYMDITYIEKEPQVKRCLIHTYTNTYYIIDSIDNLSKLGFPFFKTHQSCIINLVNVAAVDCVSNSIIFNNGERTSLLSGNGKKNIRTLVDVN